MRDNGSVVRGIPNASRTSADPDAEDDALAPCWKCNGRHVCISVFIILTVLIPLPSLALFHANAQNSRQQSGVTRSPCIS